MSQRSAALRARAGTGILIVAALSLGRVVTERLPGDDRAERPFTTSAKIGQPAQMRSGTVTVTGVQGSTKMASTAIASISPGIWVVASYTWTPSTESTVLRGARIVSGPNEWDLSYGRNRSYCSVSVPGLPVDCRVAIEAPADQLVGAHLQLYSDQSQDDYDSVADIDLGITAEQAKSWAANTDILDVPDAKFPGT